MAWWRSSSDDMATVNAVDLSEQTRSVLRRGVDVQELQGKGLLSERKERGSQEKNRSIAAVGACNKIDTVQAKDYHVGQIMVGKVQAGGLPAPLPRNAHSSTWWILPVYNRFCQSH